MTRKTRVEQIEEIGLNPGVGQDKGSLTWNNATRKYEHKEKSAIDHTHDNSSILYTTTSPTTEAVGGVPKDTEYTDEPIINVLDQILHKFQKPAILTFAFNQNPLLLEVGTAVTGNTFSWTKSNAANLKDGGILKQSGVTIDGAVDIKGTASKVEALTINNAVPGVIPFQLFGTDVQDNPVVGPIVNLQFVHPVFHGFVTQANKPLASELSITTNKRPIVSTGDVTFALNTGDMSYTWIAIPQSTQFTKWFENVENAGIIGDTGLFATGVAINVTSAQWANVPYWVYITNYRSACRTFIFQR